MKRGQIKRRPLADTTLSSLEPEASVYREHDGSGLYFRVKPNGLKSWELRYKKPDGKWSWVGIGAFPETTGAAARDKAATLRKDISAGTSPVVAKRERQAAQRLAATNTFELLGREWFQSRRTGWQPGTAKRIIGALELHVFPVFGTRPYTEISPMEWMEFFRGLEKKGIIDQAGNIRRFCKEAYDLARVTGRAEYNPVEGLHKFLQTRQAENYAHVQTDELPALLRAIRAYSGSKIVAQGLRLLTMLAVRPSELREASWAEFDLNVGNWSIPAARMKKRRDHVVPLPRQAIEALRELHRFTGAYPLLFPGRNDRTKALSNMTFNMALSRLGYGGRQTGHGFRHIASTILREQGFLKDHVEAQLSHAEDGVAAVYNKAQYIDQRRTMMQWYADYLDTLASGSTEAKTND
ncbi:tyrosine-type recombinase/integrase [Pseudomonas putida]|uniref:tyrosine-type recombinase/integrase n=1 Tax=Pseudomonas putida TaxID=303 RepID=UPI000B3CFECC|nr:tyrosine-type recombinase/integrase [Pseudomonas putida]OUS81031.1 integrase [Pseudomonas putida]OUS86068.1 integrase [Pseudomonas putida]